MENESAIEKVIPLQEPVKNITTQQISKPSWGANQHSPRAPKYTITPQKTEGGGELAEKPVATPKYKSNKSYKFCVYKGNYPATLRGVMKARGNWTEVSEDDACEQANFMFRPVNFGHPVSKIDSFLILYECRVTKN